ncbi:MAG: ABC transporter permease [Thermoleophilaceae bacterium]
MEAHTVSLPRARGVSGFRHFLYVTAALASTEFKLRYFGSVLGYMWTLLRPLLLFGILFVVFTQIVRFGNAVPHYPVVLLTGIVLYSFFSEATSAALQSFVQRDNLLRKVAFPRAAVPVAVTLTAAVNSALGLAVVVGLALFDGVTPRLTWLLVIPVVLGLVAAAACVSLALAVLYVKFRDMRPIWEVLLQLMFWGSPIIYAIEAVPASFRPLLMVNPFSVIVQQVRVWLIDPNAPTAAQAAGSPVLLLVPLAVTLAVIALSAWALRQASRGLAEDL